MAKAIVLGAGMVGSVIAADLAEDEQIEVAIADQRADALAAAHRRAGGRIETIEADLGDPERLKEIIRPFDIVCGALASVIGFQTLQAVIETGKSFCDICFMPEDPLALDDLARKHGVTAVVDCGVAPGVSNLLAGWAAAHLEPCRSIEIYVGGVPAEPKPPFHYKAAFSPYDVIEEYTRPSRIVEGGGIVEREALSEPEPMDFEGVGTLEAFNTDGLRSLAVTLDVPCMKEKTLRHPGHIDLMRAFREAGFFSHEEIEVGGARIRPIDVTSALMFPKWMYDEGEADLTVMRVIADGDEDGRPVRYQWDLLDRYHTASETTSMARTTAFPCAIVARMILAGRIDTRGVVPPECLGTDGGLLDEIMLELERRGVRYERTVSRP